jgi:alpha-galactosidase
MNDYYDSWSIDPASGVWQGTPSSPSPTALVSAESGRCLDDPGFSTVNGTQMEIWDCNRGANQQLTYQWGTLRLMGKCLDVFADQRTPGAKVELWDCNGGGNQQWNMNSDGTITAAASGLCLDVVGNNTANGASIDIWNCNGQTNQQWFKR